MKHTQLPQAATRRAGAPWRTPGSLALLAVVAGLSVPALAAFDGEAVPPEYEPAYTATLSLDAPATRESVRADLAEARRAGTITPDGEIGDTVATLGAREQANATMSQRLLAEAEHAQLMRRQALAEAELQLAEALWGEAPAELHELQLVRVDTEGRSRLAVVDPTGLTPPVWVRSAADVQGLPVRSADIP
jgi:hypothetical protein